MAEFMVKSADAYRQKHQLLLSSEIKRARERVKMSQREFASYLGVGPASVKRWELGEIQTRLADQIIRLKTDPAYAESSIAEVYSRVVVGDMEHASAKGALSERRGHVRGSTDSGNDCETLAA